MINKSTPILHVKTVEPGVKFWNERFGFKTTIEVPEGNHVGFAAIENDSVELMYQTYEGMNVDPSNPRAKAVEQGPSFIFIEVGDINAVVEALEGAEIVQGIHDTFYGAKEVIVKEPEIVGTARIRVLARFPLVFVAGWSVSLVAHLLLIGQALGTA